ncbi:MAG: hypothetical protein V7K92_22820 [Nostoc sp.]|uniref:hypothetical protein n=1 Tax=Nostoc sp. TaxID=1180 RepID=UPI002FF21D8E
MKRKNPHSPAPSPNIARRGAGKKFLSQVGEGFRVRAKTTLLNIDEVYYFQKGSGVGSRNTLFFTHGMKALKITNYVDVF